MDNGKQTQHENRVKQIGPEKWRAMFAGRKQTPVQGQHALEISFGSLFNSEICSFEYVKVRWSGLLSPLSELRPRRWQPNIVVQ